MIKIIYILLLCSFSCPFNICAKTINVEQARDIAQHFFMKKNISFKGNIAKVKTKNKIKEQTFDSPYYIFNAEKGYVIVSGSNHTPNILGYSLNSNLNSDSIPDNLQALLDSYEDQINYIEKNNIVLTNKYNTIREPIKPLLTCKWGQKDPFNLKCPTYNGRHCVTGCLATALSQVMYYYKWPQKTTQEIPGYSININGTNTDIAGIPSGTIFDWDNMLPTYDNVTAGSASKYAVATLMAAVGAALKMDYNTGTSYAEFEYYNEVPKKYFGYHENQKLIYRSDVENWEEIIYNELTAKRPVVYGGQSDKGGHAFVVDGYDGDQLFHIDWGYVNSEGYYLLDILNRYDFSGVDADYNGDGYSKSQCAIINLVPSGWSANTEYSINNNEKIESKGIRINGSLKTGQTQEVFVDLVNKGAGLYGSIQLYGKTVSNSFPVILETKGFTLKRRATRTAIIPWTPYEAGEHMLYIKINDRTLDSLSVTITPGNNTSNTTGLRLVSVHMDGEDLESKRIDPTDSQSTLVNVVGKNQTAIISINNAGSSRWEGTYRFDVCVYDINSNTYKLYQEQTGSGWGTPGYTWHYERTFNNLPCGKYRLEIYANNILIDSSWHFNIIEGVPGWAGPKDKIMIKINENKIEIPDNILAVDLTEYSGLDIIPNNNPNTLYIFNYNQDIPQHLNNRNILLFQYYSYICNYINLLDGYSYYTPYTYTAKSIKYTKKFRYASTSNNIKWETFCLPFTAHSCFFNSLSYKWCNSINDNKGNFWLEKLSRLKDNTAYFVCENESKLSAWRPYIIAVPKNIDEMTFCSENIIVSSTPAAMPRTDDYTFTSNFVQKESFDLYYFESTNGLFIWSKDCQLTPFNSYILPNNDNYRNKEISINTELVDVVEPTTINQVKVCGVRASSHGGIISLSGLNDNEQVSFYDIGGKLLGKTNAVNGTAIYATLPGQIVIVKFSDTTMKFVVE